MRVLTQIIQGWECSVQDTGVRVALLHRDQEVMAKASWFHLDEDGRPLPQNQQFLLVSVKKEPGTCVVPADVLKWLMRIEIPQPSDSEGLNLF